MPRSNYAHRFDRALLFFKKAYLLLKETILKTSKQEHGKLADLNCRLMVVVSSIGQELERRHSPEAKLYFQLAGQLYFRDYQQAERSEYSMASRSMRFLERDIELKNAKKIKKRKSVAFSCEDDDRISNEDEIIEAVPKTVERAKEFQDLLLKESALLNDKKQSMSLFVTTDFENTDAALGCRIGLQQKKKFKKHRKRILKNIKKDLMAEIVMLERDEEKYFTKVKDEQHFFQEELQHKNQYLKEIEQSIVTKKEQLFRIQINQLRKRIGKYNKVSIGSIEKYIKAVLAIKFFQKGWAVLERIKKSLILIRCMTIIRQHILDHKNIFLRKKITFRGESMFLLIQRKKNRIVASFFFFFTPTSVIPQSCIDLPLSISQAIIKSDNPIRFFYVTDDWQLRLLQQYLHEKPHILRISIRLIYKLIIAARISKKKVRELNRYVVVTHATQKQLVSKFMMNDGIRFTVEQLQYMPNRRYVLKKASITLKDDMLMEDFLASYTFDPRMNSIFSVQEYKMLKNKQRIIKGKLRTHIVVRRYKLMKLRIKVFRTCFSKGRMLTMLHLKSQNKNPEEIMLFYQVLKPSYSIVKRVFSKDKAEQLKAVFDSSNPFQSVSVNQKIEMRRLTLNSPESQPFRMTDALALIRIKKHLMRLVIQKRFRKRFRQKYLLFRKFSSIVKIQEQLSVQSSYSSLRTETKIIKEKGFYILYVQNAKNDLLINRYRVCLESLVENKFAISIEVGYYEKEILVNSKNPLDELNINITNKTMTMRPRKTTDSKLSIAKGRLMTRNLTRKDTSSQSPEMAFTKELKIGNVELQFRLFYKPHLRQCYYIWKTKANQILLSDIIDPKNALEIIESDNNSKFTFKHVSEEALTIEANFDYEDVQDQVKQRIISAIRNRLKKRTRDMSGSIMPRRKNHRRITTTKRKRTVLERFVQVNGYKLHILAVVKQEGVQIRFENCTTEVKNIKRRTTLFALQRLTIIRDRVTYTENNTLFIPWWNSSSMFNFFWIHENKSSYCKLNEFRLSYENKIIVIDFYTPNVIRAVQKVQQSFRKKQVVKRALAYFRSKPGNLLGEAVLLVNGSGQLQALVSYGEESISEQYSYTTESLICLSSDPLRQLQARWDMKLPLLQADKDKQQES